METKKQYFKAYEKRKFLEILRKYSRIIENKNNQSSALEAKNLAWQKITLEFNASPQTRLHRTSKQLRRLWMNLKQRQKELINSRYHQLPAEQTVEDVGPHVVHAIMTTIDDSMDSNILLEAVSEEPVQSEVGMYLSEDSQNMSNQEISSFNTVKIEPISPSPTYPGDDVEVTPTTVQTPPLRKNTAHGNGINIDNNTALRSLEIHDLEKELLKERIRGLYKENTSREAQATAIHDMEIQLLEEKVREAKAKADLAELLLKRQLNS